MPEPRTVLVVDDNLINRKVAIGLIRKCGLTVDTASDGQEAVERVMARRYDLVLMDCQMPVLDGYQATQTIRQREIAMSHHTPIVAMTANTHDGDREKCLAAGMDDYLCKPVSFGDLEALLARFLPGARRPEASSGRSSPRLDT